MRALKLPAQITSDHTLRLRLPEDISAGPAIDVVESENLRDFLATPRVSTRFIRSKQEIDDDLRVERERWE